MDKITQLVDLATEVYAERRRQKKKSVTASFEQKEFEKFDEKSRPFVIKRIVQYSDYLLDRQELERKMRERYQKSGEIVPYLALGTVWTQIGEMAHDELIEWLVSDGLPHDFAEQISKTFDLFVVPPSQSEIEAARKRLSTRANPSN